MKAISIGDKYQVYGNSMQAYDSIPAYTYNVRFDEMTGFYLKVRSKLAVKEKTYGAHPEKAEKVLKTFSVFERNLGVILSGDKGIGKSLFARMLAEKAQDAGYPVLIIDQFIPGISNYIQSIDQEAVFLFDEFDKTFGGVRPGDNETDPQASLLSMFDGTSDGKKLFIITCNSLDKLNDFLVNRPGRFHYHFRFGYPSVEAVKEYLEDKLDAAYRGEIPKVVIFSQKVTLNYDCLRAIAFELNMGLPFEQAIQDLNIINVGKERYDLVLHYCGGLSLSADNVNLNLFDSAQSQCLWLDDDQERSIVYVQFDPRRIVYDETRHISVIPGESLTLHYNEHYKDPTAAQYKTLRPDYLSISRVGEHVLHYWTGGMEKNQMNRNKRVYRGTDSELPF